MIGSLKDKIFGVIYGTAIGDALGWPVEFLDTVTTSKPKVFRGSLPVQYTDDTQMFRAVLEGMLRWTKDQSDGHPIDVSAQNIAEEFIVWSQSSDNDRSPGKSCMEGCRNLRDGKPWRESGVYSDGCGTAMRSMAYGLWFYDNPGKAARWASAHALMTHNHPAAQAAAAAVAGGVAVCMERFRGLNQLVPWMVHSAQVHDAHTGALLQEAAASKHVHGDVILKKWLGWTGPEAVASSLWCVLRYPDDFEAAVLLAVNSPGDSDSLGAIVGSMVGARVGFSRIPKHWIETVEDGAGLGDLAERVWNVIGG